MLIGVGDAGVQGEEGGSGISHFINPVPGGNEELGGAVCAADEGIADGHAAGQFFQIQHGG